MRMDELRKSLLNFRGKRVVFFLGGRELGGYGGVRVFKETREDSGSRVERLVLGLMEGNGIDSSALLESLGWALPLFEHDIPRVCVEVGVSIYGVGSLRSDGEVVLIGLED
jgi:hypothetical protein